MARSAFLQGLLDAGLVDVIEIDRLSLKHNARDFDIANHLYCALELGSDRATLAKLYGDSIGVAHVPLDKTLFQADALGKMTPEKARHLECIPVYRFGDVLTVATPYPDSAKLVAEIEKTVAEKVSPVLAFPHEVENAIEIQYESRHGLQELSERLAKGLTTQEEMTGQQLQKLASSANVVELVRGMLLYSIKNRASDIHIQPTAKGLAVRFRIDGALQTLLTLDRAVAGPIVSHLKVLASLDFAERRRPQDGRVSLVMKNQSHDFRLSLVPTIFGEKAVIRAIGSTQQLVTPLDQLGFSKRNRRLLDKLIQRPNGVLFVTGPTGSGKTTTLYSILTQLQRPELNIVTVEDPVELRIDGITQIQTNADIGVDFAHVLRAVLRQDPEVLLIGEVRDLETANIAAQAALTGHLVMATMHTNNSLQAVTRLIQIGVEPFLVAPAVIGVLAQRLVRRICQHCKESYEPSAEVLDSLFFNREGAEVRFYRGRGCDKCHYNGYTGRLAIHELFILTDEIREMISNGTSIIEIQKESLRHGFRSMRYDGVMKVLQGLTTIDEVVRTTTF